MEHLFGEILTGMFLSTSSVGVVHILVDINERHGFAYLQCRSSTYMWCVRDIDLVSMIHLSTRVNKN